MGHPRFVWLATCDACRSRAVTRRGEGVQLTSRSGVLKGARSRVVIGENANGGGGLAGAFSSQHSAKDAVWVTLSRGAMDLFPHALDARVGHPGKSSSKLQGKALLSPRNNTD